MFDRPDPTTLLQGMALFFDQDVRPGIEDKALAFRVRIAAHLCRSLAFQLQRSDEAELEALARLAVLLDEDLPAPAIGAERRELLATAEARLAEQIASGAALNDDAVLAHLKASLSDELQVSNPQFDLRSSIE